MTHAEKILISAAAYFLMQSYIFGIVKYRQMMNSDNAKANFYVNMSHNAPILYIAATLLLTVFAHYSVFSDIVNTCAATSIIGFYLSANLLNNFNALKGVNRTAIRGIKAQGPKPVGVLNIYMGCLVVAQVGGSLILTSGAMVGIWS
jgi:hypothetical protein